MEEWQKKFIDENLPELITSIRCDVVFLAYLVKYGALSSTDRDYLNSIQGGEVNKASALVSILLKQKDGYQHLAKALTKCVQTGAFSILLQGIQKNVMFRDVYFGGVHVPLQNICKSIDTESLKNIITSEVNAETFEQFLEPGPWTLTTETVPKEVPYYIPRTLSINTLIDINICQKLKNDIFCIEGVELHQMSYLTRAKSKYTSTAKPNPPDLSRNQRHGVSTRFILLERPDHFPDIVEKAEKPVHWLKYNEGKYWYITSSPGREVKNASKFLVQHTLQNLTEEDFVERCLNVRGNEAVFIYDSPGMGKSLLLANLARKMKESRPEDSIIHLDISDLIRKVRQVDESCSYDAVKETLVNHIAVNGIGQKIIINLLDARTHQIQLFLDGYDEVFQRDYHDGRTILNNLVKEGESIRIFVATRPHRRDELEEIFGGLGYNILPFDDSNKLSFFLKYWQRKLGVEPTDEITRFAKYCLEIVNLKMSSVEGDIAGIPLQCRMLADIFAEDAKKGCLIPTESQIQLNSIFQVYKHFIDTKFSKFCTPAEIKVYRDFHRTEALRTLFPEQSNHFHGELHVPDYELLYRIGILEPLKSDSSRPGFSHRTLAEYFAAEFLATYPTSAFPTKVIQSEFINLLFQHALIRSSIRREINFQNVVICRFLNFVLSSHQSDGRDLGALKSALRESHFYNSKTLIELLENSLRINASHLYLFLLQVYLDLEEFSHGITNFLRFKESQRDIQNWHVEVAKKLVNDLENEPQLRLLYVTTISDLSLNSLKLLCVLLENVTGKKLHQLPWNYFVRPMYIVLQRGHYQMFEYILSFDRERFYNQPLLHWCLLHSYHESLRDRLQIVKLILQERPDLLNKPHPDYDNRVPLLAYRAHVSLIKYLIEAGADLTPTREDKENIAHLATFYYSAEEYHEFVELIICRNAQIIFKQRDEGGLTPVHRALKRIDLKKETLQLLANKCNVNFNDNSTGESELAVAINAGNSKNVIKNVIRLGGNRMKLYRGSRLDKLHDFIFG